MKTSTEIASIAKVVGMEKAVELCAKAGFDAWDFSMFDMHKLVGLPVPFRHRINSAKYLSLARTLKRIGLDNGIVCNQSHAPFPVRLPSVRSVLELAIECTAEAGGEICIIHPDNNKSAEQNAEMFLELLPFAKQCGVKIATENMWNWNVIKNRSSFAACATGEDFRKHIDAVNDDFLVACLDLGHTEMEGSGDGAVNMIHTLGHRLQALHIHDNDCIHDDHQIPFSMNIDFAPIVKALRDIDYKGYFTLEADAFMKKYNKGNASEGVKKLSESARRLADEFERL